MNYTQAQIDRANAVSLEDFLRTQGETLIKSGREYRWKEHDSLTVRGNKWFRHSQSKGGYKKVDGTPPGEKWRHTTMSVPEMADLLGLKSGTAYDLVKRGYFETTLIDRRIRIITSSFEAWYQKQTHYVKISERSNENGIYREA